MSLEISTVVDLVEYGLIGGVFVGASIGGAMYAYKRLMGKHLPEPAPTDHYEELARKVDDLSGRVDRIETNIQHLPTSQDILSLTQAVNAVGNRVARIEGFVLGKQAMAD